MNRNKLNKYGAFGRMEGRTKYAIKNSKYGIFSKIVSLLLSFVSRTVFIKFLGNTYLGINGLYTEILSVLSFAELGFGTALTYSMYAPVAQNDEEKIIRLLAFYKKVYNIIALVIVIAGIAILPFLQYLVKGADGVELRDLRLYFLFFLANTVVSYFVAYKYSFFNAQMKNYIATNIDTITNFIIVSLQIVVIICFKNYYAYLITHTVLLACSKLVISIYLNKREPILRVKTDTQLSKTEKAQIYKEVKGLAVHQFASVAVHSTDNIIISSLSGLGVVAVGLISNYNMIINSVLGFVTILFSSVTSGFGNMVATSDKENYRSAFLELNFIGNWIYAFCSIAFFILIPPFITLWIGKENLIETASFLLIVLNCYLQGLSTVYNNARIAGGNFNKDKWIALAQALVNLIVSIILVQICGLVGVYIGTIVSRLVYICCRPYSTYKFLFEKSSREYYLILIFYFCVTMIAGVCTYFATKTILQDLSIVRFVLATGIVAVLPNVVFILFYGKTKECKAFFNRIKSLFRRRKSEKK